MSAADSELSRCPDLATASIRTQSLRSTVAQRSSSAIEGAASRCGALGGGFGSGTGLRCILTLARLAAASMGRAYAAPRTELAHRFVRGSGFGYLVFRGNEGSTLEAIPARRASGRTC